MRVLTRKSWQDMRRRRARSLFTIATIAAAVTGLSLFAMPSLMDAAMEDRIDEDQLHDIRFRTDDVVLDVSDLQTLGAIDGVTAIDTRTTYPARMTAGERREDVLLVGVRSFVDQQVNIVTVDDGAAPGVTEVVSDAQNKRSGRFAGSAGSMVSIEDSVGGLHEMTVAGAGDTLVFSQFAAEDRAVLYAPQESVNRLAGSSGVNSIELRVDDPESAAAITEAVRAKLIEIDPTIVFAELPDVRVAGSWPGQEDFDNFSALFYVGAVLALISSMVLISNTMTTMVAEQVREIAVMKAIGGRRRQITHSFLRTVMLLGLAGSIVGIAIGIPFSNLLVGFVGRQFFGVDPAWGVSMPVIGIGLVVGVLGSSLAAVPALRRASRISVREGFDAARGLDKSGPLDSAVRRLGNLPPNVRLGLRNVTRRRVRSLGTMVQIGLAVGVALGFLSLGVTIADVTGATWDSMSWDVLVIQRSNVELDAEATELVSGLDGVEVVHPTLYNSLEVDGAQLESWGLPTDTPLFNPDIRSGRWLKAEDEGRSVAVVGRALAETSSLIVGDRLTVGTARGSAEIEVIGIDGRLMNNGTTIYLPLTTFQKLLARSDTNTLWVRSSSQFEFDIDRLAASAESDLAAAGYPVRTEIHYVERNANLASNRVLVSVLAVMGIPIVAIGMIGLVNLMTMNVIERTREIGILRCVGARARDIRRVFRTEALTIAMAGWALSIPLGYLIGRTLAWIVTELFHFGSVPFSFPLWYVPVALVATVVLAALVVVAPVRRAARMRPGDALRYE